VGRKDHLIANPVRPFFGASHYEEDWKKNEKEMEGKVEIWGNLAMQDV